MAKSGFGPADVKMVDMKRSKASLSPKNVGKISPDPYSYDHRISLDQDAQDKLGIQNPKVGDIFHVMGEAHVHSVSSHDHADHGGNSSVGLQFKKLHVRTHEGTVDDGGKTTGTTKKGSLDAVSKGIKEADEL